MGIGTYHHARIDKGQCLSVLACNCRVRWDSTVDVPHSIHDVQYSIPVENESKVIACTPHCSAREWTTGFECPLRIPRLSSDEPLLSWLGSSCSTVSFSFYSVKNNWSCVSGSRGRGRINGRINGVWRKELISQICPKISMSPQLTPPPRQIRIFSTTHMWR